jgi:hypothetical protein
MKLFNRCGRPCSLVITKLIIEKRLTRSLPVSWAAPPNLTCCIFNARPPCRHSGVRPACPASELATNDDMANPKVVVLASARTGSSPSRSPRLIVCGPTDRHGPVQPLYCRLAWGRPDWPRGTRLEAGAAPSRPAPRAPPPRESLGSSRGRMRLTTSN